MKALSVSVLCAAAFSVSAIHGQDLSALTGTIGIEADTAFRQGTFAGCILNYRAAIQDHVYREGALVGVSGSFNLHLMHNKSGAKTFSALLKVGVKQILPPTDLQNEAPAFAYLASAQGSSAKNVIASDLSDTPGYRLFALRVDKSVTGLIEDMLGGKPLTLYYNRRPDGLDVKVPLDLMVIDTKAGPSGLDPVRSDSTVRAFGTCFQRLAQELR